MGHSNDDVFLAYISRVSGVDTQSIMSGRTPDQQLMNVLQSMTVDLDVEYKPRGRGRSGVPYTSLEDESTDSEHASDLSGVRSYDDPVVRPPPSKRSAALLAADLARQKVVAAFYQDEMSFQDTTKTLVDLVDPSGHCWHYMEASPDQNGRCQRCSKELS